MPERGRTGGGGCRGADRVRTRPSCSSAGRRPWRPCTWTRIPSWWGWLARSWVAPTAPRRSCRRPSCRTLARWGGVADHEDLLPYVRSAVINLCRSRFRRRVVPLRPPGAEPSGRGDRRRQRPTRRRARGAGHPADPPTGGGGPRYFGGLSTAETARELDRRGHREGPPAPRPGRPARAAGGPTMTDDPHPDDLEPSA